MIFGLHTNNIFEQRVCLPQGPIPTNSGHAGGCIVNRRRVLPSRSKAIQLIVARQRGGRAGVSVRTETRQGRG